MTAMTIGDRKIEVDDQGFFKNAADWTPDLGREIARSFDLQLTPAHWKVIDFVRKDTVENHGESPGPRRIVSGAGITMRDLYALFPKGPGKLVAKIAGVPKPKACL